MSYIKTSALKSVRHLTFMNFCESSKQDVFYNLIGDTIIIAASSLGGAAFLHVLV